MTNRELLARKSNEELAQFIKDLTDNYDCCAFCIATLGKKQCGELKDCKDGIQQWLEQEAKNEV